MFLPHSSQSVGTTPVITGKALKTTYHVTESYIEISIDVSVSPGVQQHLKQQRRPLVFI